MTFWPGTTLVDVCVVEHPSRGPAQYNILSSGVRRRQEKGHRWRLWNTVADFIRPPDPCHNGEVSRKP